MSLRITLGPGESLRAGTPMALRSTFANTGETPVALTFWWTRSLRITDAAGLAVPPGPGPVLPCGAAEEWTVLAPGQCLERDEPLGCTQPAGVVTLVGWSYALAAGRYRVVLIFEQPPPHGFSQCRPHGQAFAGRVESNAIDVTVSEASPGILGRWWRR
jgi:hypothetical protein